MLGELTFSAHFYLLKAFAYSRHQPIIRLDIGRGTLGKERENTGFLRLAQAGERDQKVMEPAQHSWFTNRAFAEFWVAGKFAEIDQKLHQEVSCGLI